ncbi:hypothetical protein TCAL_17004 [Tigriopus californicus]|uniref:BTB domain-containing protein n=1 Tax=Tigriopus californicus TaxID=6832 RepID=A0A553PFM1_TIGCA|nr:hypothetical protein TCAL_17004 [Tigriopus californicus]
MSYIELVYTNLDRIEYETLRALEANCPPDTADTTLIMDDGIELSAHEFVLSAFSSVFNRTCRHLQPDSNDGKYWICLRHIPTRIMESILSMMYKGGAIFPAQDFRRLRKTARHFSLNGFVVSSPSSSVLGTSFRTFQIRKRCFFWEETMNDEEDLGPRMMRPNAESRPSVIGWDHCNGFVSFIHVAILIFLEFDVIDVNVTRCRLILVQTALDPIINCLDGLDLVGSLVIPWVWSK